MYPLSYLFGLTNFKDGAWYEPSTDEQIGWMLQLLNPQSSDRVVDIGSGDGRIVAAVAQAGARATGIEINPDLVHQARHHIARAHLESKADIVEQSFWDADYSKFNKVVVYQFKTVMARLETKLLAELPRGAEVVSNTWQFPHWQPVRQSHEIFLYRKK